MQQKPTDSKFSEKSMFEIVQFYLHLVCKLFPQFPYYEDEELRVKSFQSEGFSLQQPTMEELANAGFFYKGFSDASQCYMCGKVLIEWERYDSPWNEHQTLSPDCNHVLKKRLMDGFLTDRDLMTLLDEAKIQLFELSKCFAVNEKTVQVATSLGHDRDIIAYLFLQQIRKNDNQKVLYSWIPRMNMNQISTPQRTVILSDYLNIHTLQGPLLLCSGVIICSLIISHGMDIWPVS